MRIVNLTALTIRIADADGRVVRTFEPAAQGLTVRTRGVEHDVDGVPVDVTVVTGVEGLPAPSEGTFYIVPQPVFYTSDRADFVTPDTGPDATLDAEQRVYAVRRLFGVSRGTSADPAGAAAGGASDADADDAGVEAPGAGDAGASTPGAAGAT